MTTTALPHQPRLHVLLADPDHDFFARVSLLLDEAAPRRHTVQWASSYAFAVGTVRRHPYDLCLVSSQIGRRSGNDLIAHYRTHHPELPAIMLVGGGEMPDPCGPAPVDCLDRDRLTPEMLRRAIRDAIFRTASRATISGCASAPMPRATA